MVETSNGGYRRSIGNVIRDVLDVPRTLRRKAQGYGKVVYHTTDDVFDEFDNARLGTRTRDEVGDANFDAPDWTFARNLSRTGHWTNERPLPKDADSAIMPLRLRGKRQHYRSLQDLDAAINEAGGPEAFRAQMQRKGYAGVTVVDDEFGGVSQVTFDPADMRSANVRFGQGGGGSLTAGLGGLGVSGAAFQDEFDQ